MLLGYLCFCNFIFINQILTEIELCVYSKHFGSSFHGGEWKQGRGLKKE